MTGQTEVIIGLDVGTTAVKVAAFGVNGAQGQLATALHEFRLEQPQPGWQVQDPSSVLDGIDTALADCVARLGDARVVALSLSTAMHALVGLDSRYRPLTPLVTWADSRARPEARQLRQQGLARELLRRSGTPVHPMSPLLKLIWFSRHEPELAGRVRWWVGLKDYVLHHLTGELVTELSSASATGLLSVKTRDWDVGSLELAGIKRDQLPPVLPTPAVLTLTAQTGRTLGLPRGLPVAVGAADGRLTEALAGVGGPRLDISAETVAVTPLAVSAYAQLRASVRALIDDYDEVAAMFASSLSSIHPPDHERTEFS